MGDDRDETGKHMHWTDITAKGAWLQPKRAVLDPKKDLAYLVYSSVSCRMSCQSKTKTDPFRCREPRACPRVSCSLTTTSSPMRTNSHVSTPRP
jgi:hypothetical protein